MSRRSRLLVSRPLGVPEASLRSSPAAGSPAGRRTWRNLYAPLDNPWLYALVQAVFAPGAVTAITGKIAQVLKQLPPADLLLDVGCGPSSWLFRLGLRPFGVDVSRPYVLQYTRYGASGVVASADALPFPARRFDGVWSIGLLHHLPDGSATTTVREMVRVCAPGGYVVVFDAVMPYSPWCRPSAYLIRRLDRGRFMRCESALRERLPSEISWTIDRFSYSLTGLEGLVCWSRPL